MFVFDSTQKLPCYKGNVIPLHYTNKIVIFKNEGLIMWN